MAIHGRCHCGQIEFEIDADLPARLTRCTCTFCAKRGALVAYYPPHRFRYIRKDGLGTYRWNTKQVAHHFCSNCGIATDSDSPAFEQDGSWDGKTRRLGVNARLFDDFDAEAVPIDVLDGRHLW